MNMILCIILFLLFVGWIGYNEVPFCFSGIKRSGMLSARMFGSCLLLSLFLGAVLMIGKSGGNEETYPSHSTYLLILSVLLTLFILKTFKSVSSSVTALFGAWAAVSYYKHGMLVDYPFAEISLSMFVAPLLGGLFAYVLNRIVARSLQKSSSHLFVKELYVKWGLVAGIIICGILLFYNYSLFLYPLLISMTKSMLVDEFTLGFVLLMLGVLFVTPMFPRMEPVSRNSRMSHFVASTYALIIVLLLFNFISLSFDSWSFPIIISPAHVVVAGILFLRKDKVYNSLISLLVGIVVAPVLSFLICLGLLSLSGDGYLSLFFVLALLGGRMLLKVIYRQVQRHRMVEQALEEERLRRSEAHNELNRMDMNSVTSQFDVLSSRIEMKRRELINLALHIKQQRDYLEEVSNHLADISAVDDIEVMRGRLKEQIIELRESMKFSQEMEQFYTQVDAMHKNFVSKLMMRCPNLTEQEKRLAILLRLGFSSKEIASLLNITTKSVEISRYRFRKKLKLERDENLVQYIQLL